MIEKVILVDKKDNELALMEKMEAHEKGLLHRAISVFIFNSKNEMLLQRRALNKYHSPGVWSNTACTHPRKNEFPIIAATRRLKEEMGMESSIKFAFKFIYKANLEFDLIEHELDHVFVGICDELPKINESEVCDYKYISEKDLDLDIMRNSSKYSEWFKICYKKAYLYANKNMYNKKKNVVDAF